ncbi:glycosyltransferase [Sinomonas sp. RB5]
MTARHVIAAGIRRGGGEGLMASVAEGLSALGEDVLVVGPPERSPLVARASALGLPVHTLASAHPAQYALDLLRWRRANPDGVLWCEGTLAALATAGMQRRILAFDTAAPGPLKSVRRAAARARALATIVPSAADAGRLRDARVLAPSVPALELVRHGRGAGPLRIGFMGPVSERDGVLVLADTLRELRRWAPEGYRLRITGPTRYADARERVVVEGRLRSLGAMVQSVHNMPADEFLGSVDLLVCPAVQPRGFCFPAVTAMASGVPVVVSDAGSLPEVVGPDHPWVARAGDPGHLAEVITQAAAALPAYDAVAAARHRWEAAYSPEAGRRALGAVLGNLGLGPTGSGASEPTAAAGA